MIHPFIVSLIHSLFHSSIHCSTHSFIHCFTHSFMFHLRPSPRPSSCTKLQDAMRRHDDEEASVCPSACVCPFTHPPIHQSTHPPIHLFIPDSTEATEESSS
eukprot:GHVU01103317.1.p1 GENE.GHVU01103317.1~~GHVU01103317.1.p1  ORF type:complete len:102 (-),score=4.83 GHVU01103317.1:464-769(-)